MTKNTQDKIISKQIKINIYYIDKSLSFIFIEVTLQRCFLENNFIGLVWFRVIRWELHPKEIKTHSDWHADLLTIKTLSRKTISQHKGKIG